MTYTNCLNFSEIIQKRYEQEPNFNKLIARSNEQAGFACCERIYIGSSFCGQYFLHLKEKMVKDLVAFCEQETIKVTLVIPIFTEKNLQKGKEKIRQLSLWGKDVIDEMTVNDFGMLGYIHDTYPETRLNIGRLLLKDYREPRYPEYFNTCYKPRVLTKLFKELVKKYDVKGLEFDRTHEALDFSDTPEGVEIGLHEPYTYMTVGQICEMGSISLTPDKKFRPNAVCQEECSHHHIEYFLEDGRRWLRLGKAIYFENRSCEVVGTNHIRRIYTPIEEVSQ